MSKRKDRRFWESASRNNQTYSYYYRILTELAISMFEWKNLPPTVDPRYLELALFFTGQAVFFKDEAIGYLCLRCASSGHYNEYLVPKDRRAYAANGYNKTLNDKDSVIIYNNMLRTPTQDTVDMFANRLWDLDRSIDINARAQKTPVLITCGENQRLTLENVYKEFDGNSPVIFSNNGMDRDGVKVLSTGAPFVCDKLYELKTQIWNEALTSLGISNINVVKKERLITDEVTRNLGATVANRYSRLNMRRMACEQINSMFGLNLQCDFREDYKAIEVADEHDVIEDETVNSKEMK